MAFHGSLQSNISIGFVPVLAHMLLIRSSTGQDTVDGWRQTSPNMDKFRREEKRRGQSTNF
jgi:hypothetical protein